MFPLTPQIQGVSMPHLIRYLSIEWKLRKKNVSLWIMKLYSHTLIAPFLDTAYFNINTGILSPQNRLNLRQHSSQHVPPNASGIYTGTALRSYDQLKYVFLNIIVRLSCHHNIKQYISRGLPHKIHCRQFIVLVLKMREQLAVKCIFLIAVTWTEVHWCNMF